MSGDLTGLCLYIILFTHLFAYLLLTGLFYFSSHFSKFQVHNCCVSKYTTHNVFLNSANILIFGQKFTTICLLFETCIVCMQLHFSEFSFYYLFVVVSTVLFFSNFSRFATVEYVPISSSFLVIVVQKSFNGDGKFTLYGWKYYFHRPLSTNLHDWAGNYMQKKECTRWKHFVSERRKNISAWKETLSLSAKQWPNK